VFRLFRLFAKVAAFAGIELAVFAVRNGLPSFFVVLIHQIVVIALAVGLRLD
jgi:hypothetical protein